MGRDESAKQTQLATQRQRQLWMLIHRGRLQPSFHQIGVERLVVQPLENGECSIFGDIAQTGSFNT